MATPSLRPLSLGEILDAGIKVCTRHWKTLALCVIVPLLPLSILQVLLIGSIDAEQLEFLPETDTSTTSADDIEAGVWVTLGITALIGVVSFLVVNTACFKAVADAWLGATPEAGRSLRFGISRAPRIFVLSLIAAPPVLLGFVLCLVPGFWLVTVWSLALAASLFERVGPFKALGRSYGLIRERFWATLLLLIVSWLLVGILGGIISSIPSAFAEIFASENRLAAAVANVVGTTLGNVITYPFSAAVLTILYFDQRIRKEGFDVQMLAEGLGRSFDPDAPIPAPLEPGQYTPPPQGWQPQGQYGGWNVPSHQDAPLRWGPAAQNPPDARPPEESPWMRPAPGAPGAPPQGGPGGPPQGAPGGPPSGPSRWAPPTPPAGPPPAAPAGPPTGPGGSQPAGAGGSLWDRPAEGAPRTSTDEEARWGRPSEAPPSTDEARSGRPSEGAPATPDEEARWGRPPATPGDGLTSGSPLGDEAAPTDPLPPVDEPTDPLPPKEEPPAWESRWGASSPFGESPWEDKKDKKDKDRADWQPPEEPRGPGGL
ncbi:hypothetical protein C8N24_3896 [Solirubrobacter pauli]|uniref:Glycerophosphoryl diester phosphodiesterase family protein n=1 Tax=Solirubrobacter pauli TaxID=166793 RepID=A0A660LIU5_9ACTN|nr:hypothetical protein [Solirubrobacter pauli]RKQ94020.1 hypothetical protein C8N24_3896 [Solirubrobacter pauli]